MTNKITHIEESEAAIWAEGTQFTGGDIIREYRSHLASEVEPLGIQEFCEQVLGIANKSPRSYRVAVADINGDWEILEEFEAFDDDEANAYAEQHHAGVEWYVLDDGGDNINDAEPSPVYLVAERRIYADLSGGQGHHWVTVKSLPENIESEIESEIIDRKTWDTDDYVASNGIHYSWGFTKGA